MKKNHFIMIIVIIIVFFGFNFVLNSTKNEQFPDSENAGSSTFTATHTGTILLEDESEMKFELYGDTAPKTVENFVKLANDGFYDGLIFHRVINGFMIQGGCPLGTGTGSADETIIGEFSSNGFENNLSHDKGILSMARSSANDSASSQFFIMHELSTHLDGSYAAFGKIIEGIDIVDKIALVETGANDKPITDIVIKSITID